MLTLSTGVLSLVLLSVLPHSAAANERETDAVYLRAKRAGQLAERRTTPVAAMAKLIRAQEAATRWVSFPESADECRAVALWPPSMLDALQQAAAANRRLKMCPEALSLASTDIRIRAAVEFSELQLGAENPLRYKAFTFEFGEIGLQAAWLVMGGRPTGSADFDQAVHNARDHDFWMLRTVFNARERLTGDALAKWVRYGCNGRLGLAIFAIAVAPRLDYEQLAKELDQQILAADTDQSLDRCRGFWRHLVTHLRSKELLALSPDARRLVGPTLLTAASSEVNGAEGVDWPRLTRFYFFYSDMAASPAPPKSTFRFLPQP